MSVPMVGLVAYNLGFIDANTMASSHKAPSTSTLLIFTVAALAAAGVGWLIVSNFSESSSGVRADAEVPRSASSAQVESASREIREHLEESSDPHVKALRTALMENPNDMEALLSLGDLYVKERQYTKAKGYYLRASQVAPENLEARTHLGTVAYFLGDVDEALHHYDQVLSLNPDYTVALFEMGAVLRYGKQDLPAAVKAWERFLELDPDAEEAARIRALVKESRQIIAEGPPAVRESHPPQEPLDPESAPWPGADSGHSPDEATDGERSAK